MEITCVGCGGVESTTLCKRCGGTGKIEIAGDVCPHYLAGTQTVTYCADCGMHNIGGEWFPSPGERIALLAEEIEQLKSTFREKEDLYRHALFHVAECDQNCTDCQRIAKDTLNRAAS